MANNRLHSAAGVARPRRWSGFACGAFAALALAWFSGNAHAAGSCDASLPTPDELQSADRVQDYRSVLRLCHGDAGDQVAIRAMTLEGKAALLLADPVSLKTSLERATCWRCEDTTDDALAGTRMMGAVARSAEAPGLERRGFLENAGLTHGEGQGGYFTGDLCPSSRPLDRDFLRSLGADGSQTPIGLSISGLWLKHHFADYRWLLDREAAGALVITWINHTYHHPYKRGIAMANNFLLTPGVDPDEEILEVERLLIANGGTPSLFFRFPGLVSNSPLMSAVRRHHLISLGADAWLALNEKPKTGSIVLVHPNGNEEKGLRLFVRDESKGLIPKPLLPIASAP